MSKPLSFYADVDSGQGAPQSKDTFVEPGNGIPFIRAGSLEFLVRGEEISKCEHITEEVAAKYRLKKYPKGSIVFAKSGMSSKIGRVYQLDKDAFIVNHLAVVIPKIIVDTKCLKYWLEANSPSKLIVDEAYPSIRISDIRNYQISIPESIKEQKHIATILDKADAIRKKRQKAITELDNLLKSTFLDMFGDPVVNSKNWKVLKLEECAELYSGVTKGRRLINKETISVPYMRVANVQDGYIDLNDIKNIDVLNSDIAKYSLQYGDILLTEGGDPDKLGRGAVWYEEIQPCIHQNHIFKVRANQQIIEPEYLCFQIGSQRGKRYFLKSAKQTTGIATINKTQLKNYPVLIPPLKMQYKFCKFHKNVKNQISKYTTLINESENLFKSIIQRAFKGEL